MSELKRLSFLKAEHKYNFAYLNDLFKSEKKTTNLQSYIDFSSALVYNVL